MWPSTSWGTCRGSQFGIWLATAVIRPKLNDATPSNRRSRRRTARRSFLIRRRCPFEAGAGLLRLRRSKRTILALSAVLDGQERTARRSVGAAVLLHRVALRGYVAEDRGEPLLAVEPPVQRDGPHGEGDRGAGRDGCRRCGWERPARAQRNDVRTFALRLLEDPRAQLGRRDRRLRRI